MKSLLTFCCSFLVTFNAFALTWDQLFDAYRDLFSENSLIQRQYLAYISHESPTIADPKIKQIPIHENHEALIDLYTIENTRLQMMPSPSFPFEAPYFNSGLPNSSKIRLGLYHKLEAMIHFLDYFSFYFGYEPGQISIHLFEGLRDLTTQSMLFYNKLEEIQTTYPHLTLEQAEQETAKWVSPVKNNIPVHSTGAAVDIRLWDQHNKKFIDMGMFGVIWGTNQNAPTFSEQISDECKKNRLYCLIAAEYAGLTNYSYEFWHFSSQDRYAMYWLDGFKCASYGSID